MTTLTAPLSRPAVSPRGFRLSRRGRLVLRGVPFLLGVAALTVLAAFFAGVLLSPAAVSSEHPAAAAVRTVTVMPGDSLWSIAAATAPGEDPFQAMRRIAELNDLHGRDLQAGTTLFVPVQG